MTFLFQDLKANKGNFKGQLVTFLFRLMQVVCSNKLVKIVCIPYVIFYKILVEWFLNIELPYHSVVGKGFSIYHGHATVINQNTIIGKNCILRQSVTIGNKLLSDGSDSRSPEIGDGVEIGANTCIIGPITIGNNVTIGAGSVVVKSIQSNCVVAGNPAKVIRVLTDS